MFVSDKQIVVADFQVNGLDFVNLYFKKKKYASGIVGYDIF